MSASESIPPRGIFLAGIRSASSETRTRVEGVGGKVVMKCVFPMRQPPLAVNEMESCRTIAETAFASYGDYILNNCATNGIHKQVNDEDILITGEYVQNNR